MNDDLILGYVSHYRDERPKRGKGVLFWTSLLVHAAVLSAVIVLPLFEVSADLPELESVSTFMARPPAPPPPPPPPPPAARPASLRPSSPRAPRIAPPSGFVAPVAIPTEIPEGEGLGAMDFGVPGGVPGGVIGGIVGGISDAPASEPPQDPVRVDFRRQEARPIRRVEPVYPDLATQARVQGIVILEVLVNENGVPSKSTVLRSVPLLDAAAIDAVEQWRWNPYVVAGRAVPFLVTVTVNFRLMTS